MLFWLSYFAVLTAIAAVLTGGALAWLKRRAILDAPNDRSNHDTPTPRGGGLAIVGTVLIGWLAIVTLRPDLTTGLHPGVFAAAAVLCVLSWLDDLRGLGAAVRLPVHLAACAAGVWMLPGDGLVFQGLMPVWLDGLLAVLFWAGFVNFYNFMDGIDAITGVETIGIAAGLIVVALLLPSESLPVAGPLLLIAAALGFLWWNRPPAQLFMGDVGSVPLGFLIGWFLLFLAVKGYWLPALLLPAYYLADAGLTLLRRAGRLEKIWLAHREHFYQRAVAARMARGMPRASAHGRISAAIGCVNVMLIAAAALSLSHPAIALCLALTCVGGLLWWMNR